MDPAWNTTMTQGVVEEAPQDGVETGSEEIGNIVVVAGSTRIVGDVDISVTGDSGGRSETREPDAGAAEVFECSVDSTGFLNGAETLRNFIYSE